jgi:pimeloyl-ACP methyl ester carboxylesterase
MVERPGLGGRAPRDGRVRGAAITQVVGSGPTRPRVALRTRRSPRRLPHGIANFARRVAGPRAPTIDRLGEIDVPALVIVGEKDDHTCARPRCSRRACRAPSGARSRARGTS